MNAPNPSDAPLGPGFLPYLAAAADRRRPHQLDDQTILDIVHDAEQQFVADLIREFNATDITKQEPAA